MRVVLSTYGSRGDVEPMVGFAMALRAHGAEVRLCAPPDEEFAALLACVGVRMVPAGPSARALTAGAVPPSPASLPRRAAELVAAQYAAVASAAEGCDALVATGPVPATAGARAAADRLGIRYAHVSFQPITLPSPHHPPLPYPGRAFPPGVTDNRALWELDARSVGELFGGAINAHRASIGLPPVDNARDHVVTERPWLAADPILAPWREHADLDVVQTGAWIRPDDRPLPDELEAFLEAGPAPVYVGFGSMPLREAHDAARVVVEAVRARGSRAVLARGWADLAPIDDRGDCCTVGEVNQQALFGRVAAVVHHGGAGTTTTATRAGAPQVVVPQMVDQPYFAGRVAALGVGVAHDGPTPTVASLSAALAAALAPETRARAKAVARTISGDGTTVAARLLLDEIG